MDFREDQITRYSRHILLPEIGGTGQAKLLGARVLVVGAGGLGAPLLLYLAAAGIGTLGAVDHDELDLWNLQRQVIHTTDRVGRLKVESAGTAVAALNPDVRFVPHAARLTADNVMELIAAYDIVADGTDNFAARFLLNDACFFGGKPLISAALLRFDGQLSTFKAHEGPPHPCYRCVFREPPPPDLIPSCSEAGVMGATAGVMGTLQATEVVKELLGIGDSLSGTLLMYDALRTDFRRIRIRRDPECPLCGEQASIRDLSLHRAA